MPHIILSENTLFYTKTQVKAKENETDNLTKNIITFKTENKTLQTHDNKKKMVKGRQACESELTEEMLKY